MMPTPTVYALLEDHGMDEGDDAEVLFHSYDKSKVLAHARSLLELRYGPEVVDALMTVLAFSGMPITCDWDCRYVIYAWDERLVSDEKWFNPS